MDTETRLPDDVYSRTLSRLLDNPAGVTTKGSTIDLVTLLGHAETWVVKTIRIDGLETVFIQRVNAEGGMRLVLPPEVTAAIARQSATNTTIVRRRGARRAVQTRKERGIEPAFLKGRRKARK